MNPFLNEYDTPLGVPPFDKITNADYKPAFEAGIQQQLDEIVQIIRNSEEPTFENIIVALDKSGEILRNVSMVFYGINSANTSEEMQEIDKAVDPLLSRHSDDVLLNARLFEKVKAVYDQKDQLKLNTEEAKLLEETYKRFIRSGASLSAENQVKLREINQEISGLELAFRQNLLAETNAYQLLITDTNRLNGLSESQKTAAHNAAEGIGKEGWLFTLHNPSIMPFLQFGDDRAYRRKILNAYLNRGSNNNANDNKEVVARLVAKRLEKAKLLGYNSYAEYALDDRMAKTPKNVYTLLDRIWAPALDAVKREAADMQSYINESKERIDLEAWDWRYYNEKVMKSKFDLDEEMLRPYFRLENVRDGIFYVCNQLYGITFNERTDLPKYHEEVVIYECKDTDGSHLGLLYLDFFPRPGKQGGAWCGTYRSQIYEKGKKIPTITTIVCNFTRPVGDVPALLSPDEAETFFHEFGHALNNLFQDVHYYGTSDVPRDFVELPSQIMEHWVFQPEVLKQYAKHYQTGEVIPAELIVKLEKSGKYGQGFKTAEYLAASYLDMDYHIINEVNNLDVIDFEKKSMDRLGLIRQIPPRYRTTYFNHTMGGGYTAGYYSYIWAEVLDADAFDAFEETGNIFDKKTAESFRKNILAPGGINDAMDMYVKFRGHEPDISALLKNRGLVNE